ncbi:hypothetical protein Ahy_A09g045182 [Arachis hypogaea]|uniref:Coenzyme Q-binding protein COQ10 START domain-containing protein n=1 Tax=Arachis hypogaea TaxID=3818 RepID=A0A445BLR5_ARAHY|nr:hypothetical protein Ahy_A09g045182 [Arachis hypogaea]
MSSTATLIGSVSTTPHFSSSNTTTRTRFRTRTRTFSSTPQSLNHSFFRLTNAPSKRASSTPSHGFKRFSPVMEWQDCTVKTEVDVPVSVAYACYSDREAIPNWMPFISSVKILPDKPDLSRWSLNYKAFGRDIEFSWLAPHSKSENPLAIAGRSSKQLTVSYEVPQLLAPVASALQPFLANLLERGLEQFASRVSSSITFLANGHRIIGFQSLTLSTSFHFPHPKKLYVSPGGKRPAKEEGRQGGGGGRTEHEDDEQNRRVKRKKNEDDDWGF